MSVVIPSLRAAIAVPPWVKNELWRRARAVPSLDLRFADNKSLVDAVTGASLITFNRASSGTYTDSAGVIQTASNNVPRFDHNPITGESLGLLVEEQRTNQHAAISTMVGARWLVRLRRCLQLPHQVAAGLREKFDWNSSMETTMTQQELPGATLRISYTQHAIAASTVKRGLGVLQSSLGAT
jgi:hypothetical protein